MPPKLSPPLLSEAVPDAELTTELEREAGAETGAEEEEDEEDEEEEEEEEDDDEELGANTGPKPHNEYPARLELEVDVAKAGEGLMSK